eukprot:722657_1
MGACSCRISSEFPLNKDVSACISAYMPGDPEVPETCSSRWGYSSCRYKHENATCNSQDVFITDDIVSFLKDFFGEEYEIENATLTKSLGHSANFDLYPAPVEGIRFKAFFCCSEHVEINDIHPCILSNPCGEDTIDVPVEYAEDGDGSSYVCRQNEDAWVTQCHEPQCNYDYELCDPDKDTLTAAEDAVARDFELDVEEEMYSVSVYADKDLVNSVNFTHQVELEYKEDFGCKNVYQSKKYASYFCCAQGEEEDVTDGHREQPTKKSRRRKNKFNLFFCFLLI